MTGERDNSNEGWDEVTSYDYDTGAAGGAVVADCADCGGTGNVCLLITSRRCVACSELAF